jgi:lipopolysaccharide/colanic/teichoic acid biosynthesis glycosyltransferase
MAGQVHIGIVNPSKGPQSKVKRLLDILLSSFGIAISSPLWIVIGIAIYTEDKGSIFYFQDRVGMYGEIFKMAKFRSMKDQLEKSPIQAVDNDPRITSVGKFIRRTALDELPQLFNILKGDMSFVGPRALPPVLIVGGVHNIIFDANGFNERASVRPGLTGVAQVSAARDSDTQEKFRYDIWYVRNQSLLLDIKLIVKSIVKSITGTWG